MDKQNIVVVIDTGIWDRNSDHNVIGSYNLLNSTANVVGAGYHGSFVHDSILETDNDANVFHIKISDGQSASSNLIDLAFDYVIDTLSVIYDVVAVNLSWGTTNLTNTPTSTFLEDEFQRLNDIGSIVTVASGNSGNYGTNLLGASSLDNVWSVSALTDNGQQANYSDEGVLTDVWASGTEYLTVDDGTTYVAQGTSFAAPKIAGIVSNLQDQAEDDLGRLLSVDELNYILDDITQQHTGTLSGVDRSVGTISNFDASYQRFIESFIDTDPPVDEPDSGQLPATDPEPEPEPEPEIVAEFGTIEQANHQVQTVSLNNSFENPVIIANVTSSNGWHEVVVRITDVQSDSFSFYLQEPNYRDGWHVNETVSFMVVEAGRYELSDGTIFEAGNLNTSNTTYSGFQDVNFSADFEDRPVVISQAQTENGSDFINTRHDDVSGSGFTVALEAEERLHKSNLSEENIGWIAIEQGSGILSDLENNAISFEAGTTGTSVNHRWHELEFEQTYDDATIFAQTASYNGWNAVSTRIKDSDGDSAKIKLQEDRSNDREVWHVREEIDWFVFEGDGALTGTNLNDDFFA